MRTWGLMAVFLMASCATQRLEKERAEWLNGFGIFAPPTTIAVNDSFYFDVTEITNDSWMEYVNWVGSVYGPWSPEYRACLPDNSVWFGG